MSLILSTVEQLFIAKETTFGTAVAATGSNACRVLSGIRFNARIGSLIRPAKTLTRGQTAASRGRVFGDFSIPVEMAGSGSPGVVPDCDGLISAGFGKNATIVATTSCTYGLADTIPSLTIYDYRQTGAEQRAMISAVITELLFEFGGDFGLITATGEAVACIDDKYFSSVPANSIGEKGGLSAFPAVPTSPVTNGTPALGFTGLATFDGNVIAEILTGRITIRPGNSTKKNQFGSFIPTSSTGTRRTVSIEFTADESDSTSLTNLKIKSKTKQPITIIMQIGTVAGNIWTFTLNNVVLDTPTITDPDPNFQLSFGSSTAAASTITAYDDISLAIT